MSDVSDSTKYYRSGLDFRDIVAKDAPISDPVPGVTICASSAGLGWNGAYAETGQSREWAPDGFVLEGDYLAMNLGASVLPVEVNRSASFQTVRMNPGSIWIQRRDEPFSMRFRRSFYGGLAIDRQRSIGILGDGRELDLETQVDVEDDVLSASMRALLLEMQEGGPSGPLVAGSRQRIRFAEVTLRAPGFQQSS
jgi:hypothetical protein